MNTPTIAQSTEVHESLRHLIDAKAACDIRTGPNVAPALLPEGDSHWVNQDEVRHGRLADEGPGFAVVRVYDLATGERKFEGGRAPAGWYPEQMGAWYDRLDWFARNWPNTYVVNGEYLFVSGGAWVVTGLPNAAGEVEFTSWSSLNAEAKAEAAQERAEWLAENAEAVAAVCPEWADANLTWVDLVTVNDDDDLEPDMIEFRCNVGDVAIEQSCSIENGVYSLMGEPQIRITTAATEEFIAVDDASHIGANLITAAYHVHGNEGDVSVAVVAVVARALGVRPGDLLRLAESNT